MARVEVLVVEDEVFIAMDLQARLERFGYSVIGIAATGEDAIVQALENRPDLVLMDLMLGGKIDGVEAAKRIRNQFSVPVIFLTAHGDEKNFKRAQQTKAFGYLVKPFQDRELQFAIEIALDKNREEKKLEGKKQWYSSILSSLTDAILGVGPNQTILFANQASEELFEIMESELIGQNLQDLFDCQNSSACFTSLLKEAQRKKHQFRADQLLQWKFQERDYELRVIASAIQGEAGEFKGVLFTFRNPEAEIIQGENLVSTQESVERKFLLEQLTYRERQIIQLIVNGETTKVIADRLNISTRTVEFHRYNAMRKLNVKDVPSLVKCAIQKLGFQ